MERDNIIDSKLKDLREKKESLEKKLAELPKFITNMVINTPSKNFNLRTCSSIEDFYEAYKIIHSHIEMVDKFNEFIAETGNMLPNVKVYGYTVIEWDADILTAIDKMTINKKLTSINKALKELEKFYSGDRKEENAFNALLDDIDNI